MTTSKYVPNPPSGYEGLRSWQFIRNAFLASPYDDFKSFLELHRNSFIDFEANVLVDVLLAGIAMHQLTNLEALVHGDSTQ